MSVVKFKITIQEKGKKIQYTVEKDEFVIGRGKDADLVIQNDLISRAHLRVSLSENKIWIEELGSSNGSWYSEKKLVPKTRVIYDAEEQLILGGKLGLPIQLGVDVEVSTKTHEEFWERTKVVGGPDITLPKFEVPSAVKLVRKEDKIEDNILDIKSDAEKALFMQIKNLLGNEAEAIRSACLDEAQRIKKSAEHYSAQQYKEAKDKSDKLLKQTEDHIRAKITELKSVEADALKRLEALRSSEDQAKQHVTELKAAEGHYQNSIKLFEEKIASEEARIKAEIAKLTDDKHSHEALKHELERKIEDFNLEERKFHARVETELLEAKMKVTQINGEYERIATSKQQLEPEVSRLRQERAQLEDTLQTVRLSKREEEHGLEKLRKEWEQIKFNLEEGQKNLERAFREAEAKKDELIKWQFEIKKCEEDKIIIIEDARKQSAAILEEARTEARKHREAVEEQIFALKTTKNNLESDIEKERARLTAQLEFSMKKLNDKKADLIKEIERMAKNGHEEYHKSIQQGQDEANLIIQNGKDRAEILLRDAQAVIDEKHKIQLAEIAELEEKKQIELADLQARKDALLKEEQDTHASLASQKQIASDEIAAQKKMHDEEMASQKKLLNDEIEASRREQERLVAEAQAEAQRIIKKNVEEVEVLRKSMINGAEAQVNAILSEIEQKGKDARKKEEALFAELKHAENLKLKQMRSESEQDWLNTKTERAKTVATNVYALIAGEMYKHQNKELSIEFIEALSKGLKEKVMDTMLDRIGPDNDKLQEILKTGENAKNKEKIFWKKVQIGGAAAVFLIALIYSFPGIISGPKNMIVSAFSEKSDNGSNEFLEQMKEKRKLKIFDPATTADFKDTYVDNVLYTTNYFTNFEDKNFQDKWILDLNDWFVKGLDVKDTTIIKFVSLESNLVKELQQMKEKTDGSNPDPSIEEMKAREKVFREKLAEIFEDHDKVSRFYQYRERFWNNHWNPRRPAGK